MSWLILWGALKRGGSAILTWLGQRSFWQLAFGAVAIFALIQHFTIAGERRHSAKLQSQLTAVTKARADDRRVYQQAQADAQAKNLAEVHATEQRYKRNNDEAVTNLNARLERLRRELQSSPAPQGSPGKPGSPKADDPGAVPGEARVCIAAKDFLRAAENEERFDQLITLIRKQTQPD